VLGALVSFVRLLRAMDVSVGPDRTTFAAEALACVQAGDRTEAYWALRSSLVSRAEDAETFDRAFAAFWDETPLPRGEPASRVPPGPAEGDGGDDERRPEISRMGMEQGPGEDSDGDGLAAGARWSRAERLREVDFAAYGPAELSQARALIARLAGSLPMRRSRRVRPGHRGERPDRRRILRESIRTGGEVTELVRQQRVLAPRRLGFVVDVSGSMEPYARPVVMFLHAVSQAAGGVEAFAFGTRLTRLTSQLAHRDPDRAVAAVSRAVPDWAGGTRIGESLRELRLRFGQGIALRGATVVIVSDGWERGEVTLLAAEMERLRRLARSVIWVNPLAGDPGYEPLAAGMAAALPFVDEFMPGRNLADLETLAEAIERSGGRRGGAATARKAGAASHSSYNVVPSEGRTREARDEA
jgi:uncharacterized protein